MRTSESFWKKVKISGLDDCWEWQGARTGPNKYAQTCYYSDGRLYYVHRIAYHLTREPIPLSAPKDQTAFGFVLHSCDNRICCNPAHLFLGTQSDNLFDMQKKKRHPRAKLSVEQVKEIRRRAATKQESQRAIAKAIGVNHSSVWMVINKRSYPYVV